MLDSISAFRDSWLASSSSSGCEFEPAGTMRDLSLSCLSCSSARCTRSDDAWLVLSRRSRAASASCAPRQGSDGAYFPKAQRGDGRAGAYLDDSFVVRRRSR